jgi:hypothetical protein
MNIDTKILKKKKTLETEFNSTLKRSYTMIKLDLIQGCKAALTYANQT